MDSKERPIVLSVSEGQYRRGEGSFRGGYPPDVRRPGRVFSAPTLRWDDIASLQRAKEDIVVREVSGKGTFFKYLGREWSEAELQILIDAISAGQFISEEQERPADR